MSSHVPLQLADRCFVGGPARFGGCDDAEGVGDPALPIKHLKDRRPPSGGYRLRHDPIAPFANHDLPRHLF